MKNQHIEISGMTCGHCVMNVRKELSRIEGLTINEVKIGAASITSDETHVSEQQIVAAIEEAGYTVSAIH